jgi:hypothetical protein
MRLTSTKEWGFCEFATGINNYTTKGKVGGEISQNSVMIRNYACFAPFSVAEARIWTILFRLFVILRNAWVSRHTLTSL